MLSNIASVLNLLKYDILFLFGSEEAIKSKFFDFVQQVLGSFRSFYDMYFDDG